MRKLMLSAAAAAAFLAASPAAHAITVPDPTPTKSFSDSKGNAGYVEVDPAGAVRACNENEATPAGDRATGYVYVSKNGESVTPTYGNQNVGAGDADGEAGTATDQGHDCK